MNAVTLDRAAAAPHSPDMTPSTTDKTETLLRHAKAIAFDGCHKIYIAMTYKAAMRLQANGYGSGADGSKYYRVGTAKNQRRQAVSIVRHWYDQSCGWRFIHAVHGTGERDEDYEVVVDQGEEW